MTGDTYQQILIRAYNRCSTDVRTHKSTQPHTHTPYFKWCLYIYASYPHFDIWYLSYTHTHTHTHTYTVYNNEKLS